MLASLFEIAPKYLMNYGCKFKCWVNNRGYRKRTVDTAPLAVRLFIPEIYGRRTRNPARRPANPCQKGESPVGAVSNRQYEVAGSQVPPCWVHSCAGSWLDGGGGNTVPASGSQV